MLFVWHPFSYPKIISAVVLVAGEILFPLILFTKIMNIILHHYSLFVGITKGLPCIKIQYHGQIIQLVSDVKNPSTRKVVIVMAYRE